MRIETGFSGSAASMPGIRLTRTICIRRSCSKSGAACRPLKEKQFANTWLYRVAINTAISFIRKRTTGAARVVHFGHAELTRTIELGQPTLEKSDERMADLYTAIYKLDPLEKALVTLFLEDFTYEQMAEATGLNANNVGVMLHRAKKKLFCLMNEEAPK